MVLTILKLDASTSTRCKRSAWVKSSTNKSNGTGGIAVLLLERGDGIWYMRSSLPEDDI